MNFVVQKWRIQMPELSPILRSIVIKLSVSATLIEISEVLLFKDDFFELLQKARSVHHRS